MTLLASDGSSTSSTALQTARAYSGSAPVKLSGEYSKRKLPSYSAARPLTSRAPSTAMSMISCLDLRKTCSRWATLTEL